MECKRIPSARVSCEALGEIAAHECLYANREASSFWQETLLPLQPILYESAILQSLAHLPKITVQKYVSQLCEPYTFGSLLGVSNWSAKTTYYYGRYRSHGVLGVGKKEFCLYHGKERISARYMAQLSHRLHGGSGGLDNWLELRPWLKYWDDPEYYIIWKDSKYQKKISFRLVDGSIEYWDDQDKHQTIPPLRIWQFGQLDMFIKSLDGAYKRCMDKPTERFWR